jgi:hypothetical protein
VLPPSQTCRNNDGEIDDNHGFGFRRRSRFHNPGRGGGYRNPHSPQIAKIHPTKNPITGAKTENLVLKPSAWELIAVHVALVRK